MFEDLDDAALVAGIEDATRAAAVQDARRWALIAELADRRLGDEDDERHLWVCDFWDAAAAEVAAAMGVAHRTASGEMRKALALRDRLPLVAALFHRGELSARLVSLITWRTQLVEDPHALAELDAGLAQRAVKWGSLSVKKLEGAIDDLIIRHDRGAVRRTRDAVRDRDVRVGKPDDVTGTVTLYGCLTATDGKALENRIKAMLDGVCADDPRTMGQRRSDALGVIAANGDQLPCQCGKPECAAAGVADARAANTVVYILADPDALTAHPDPYVSGDRDTNPLPANVPAPARDPEPAAEAAPETPAAEEDPAAPDAVPSVEGVSETPAPAAAQSRASWSPGMAVIVDGGVIPTPLLAQLIAAGATVRPLPNPGQSPEPRYRPSTRLAAWVRMRDMSCMFPGCDRPAEFCDVDHTEAYPDGSTHPSNLKSLCRLHHLLKTFWDGWRDHQHPDGTIEWTTPSGRTYTKKPGFQLFFPDFVATTATLPPPVPRTPNAGANMPRRTRTRTAQWARQFRTERTRDTTHDKPPPC